MVRDVFTTQTVQVVQSSVKPWIPTMIILVKIYNELRTQIAARRLKRIA
jgi:hypothetical protein